MRLIASLQDFSVWLESQSREPQLYVQTKGDLHATKPSRCILPYDLLRRDLCVDFEIYDWDSCRFCVDQNHGALTLRIDARKVGGGCNVSRPKGPNQVAPATDSAHQTQPDPQPDPPNRRRSSPNETKGNSTDQTISTLQEALALEKQKCQQMQAKMEELESHNQKLQLQISQSLVKAHEMDPLLNAPATVSHVSVNTSPPASTNRLSSKGSLTPQQSTSPEPSDPTRKLTSVDHHTTKETPSTRSTPKSGEGDNDGISDWHSQGAKSGNAELLTWINHHLEKIDMVARNLTDDISDGFLLILLIDVITGNAIPDYRSRMKAEESIQNPDWVADNHQKLRMWLLDNSVQSYGTSVEELFESIIWTLVFMSVGDTKFDRSPASLIRLAKSVMSELDIPFFFKHLNIDGKESAVLLAVSILKDRLSSLKADTSKKRLRKWTPRPHNYKTCIELEDRILDEGVLRIFLSSTFRDMQKERDMFFLQGVPELKGLAKTKGLDLVFIDLRWGLTAQDSSDGWVVVRCCDSIKKCPYFVCFLGSRYGWVPDSTKTELNKEERFMYELQRNPNATIDKIYVDWHSETNKRYPFLDAIPGLSVTEYEIQYAALIPKPACSRVFFYFRDEQYALEHASDLEERKLYEAENPDSALRQKELMDKIQSRYGAVTYRGPADFSNLVTSHLAYAIGEDFSGRQVREPEDQAHYQFMQHRLAGFEGRKAMLQTITDEVREQFDLSESQITVLAAESGIGKSSLIAATVRDLNLMKMNHTFIFYHFVGCTNLSNYVESISIRFWRNVRDSRAIPAPEFDDMKDSDFQKEGLHGLMKLLGSKSPNQRFVFLIDAINQLHPSQDTPAPHMLAWLPKKSPKNVAMVVSTIDTHPSCHSLKSKQMRLIPVTKLTKEEIQQSATTFLDRYDKRLAPDQMQMILEDTFDTGHPLYLRLMLDEIRVFGLYEKLRDEIQILLSTSGVVELYNLIISRWETKYNFNGAQLVETAMKVLYISRIGLSEGDLDKYIEHVIGVKFNLPEWKSFFFTLVESLFVRNGRYMYFHQLLLETTKERFFGDQNVSKDTQKEYGLWLLGQYADIQDAQEEVVAEICYQLSNGECFEALIEYLKKENVVVSMLGGRYRYEFFTCWRSIHKKGAGSYKDTYSGLVKTISKAGDMLVDFFVEAFENSFLVANIPQLMSKRTTEEAKAGDYLTLGRVYKNMQNWKDALYNLKRCLEVKIHSNQEDESLAALYDEIGEIQQQQNSIEEAFASFEKSFFIRKQLFGDLDIRVALSHDLFGNVYFAQGKYLEASKSFSEAKFIRSKLVGADHPLIATSMTNMAKVDLAERNYEKAINNLERAQSIWEVALGTRHPSVASVICQIANVYESQGKIKDSISLLNGAAEIFIESVGENHPSCVNTLEKIGEIEHDSRNYAKALEYYKKVLEIRKRTLDNKNVNVATAYESVGKTNFELKRNDQVAEYFLPASIIRKETKTHASVKSVSQCVRIAELMEELKEYDAAILLYKTSIIRFCENQGYESWDAWKFCEKVDKICRDNKKYEEAVDFWSEARDEFDAKLGSTHDRTLSCCEYLSFYSNNLGKKTKPIDFTKTRHLVQQSTGVSLDSELLDTSKTILMLLSIVYESRSDPRQAEFAAKAISFLNFMKVPLSGLNLSGVNIPSANLMRAVMDGADFSSADLRFAKLHQSILGSCNLDESNLENVELGLSQPILKGHADWVRSICLVSGPDGQPWLVSGGDDKTIRVWDIGTALQIKSMEGKFDCVYSICSFTGPNGENWLASAGKDKIIRVWDLATGTKVTMLKGHTNAILSICSIQGPNQRVWLASGSNGNTIRIWDVSTKREVKSLSGHTSCVSCVCNIQGPDGRNLLISGSYQEIKIWDIEYGKEIKTIKGHLDTVSSLTQVIGPGGEKWLASASWDKTVKVWDLENYKEVKVFYGHTSWVSTVCSLPGKNGESWLASGSDDNTIRIWDLTTGKEVKVLNGHTGHVYSICIVNGPNGEYWLASGSYDSTIRLWDVEMGALGRRIADQPSDVQGVTNLKGPNAEKWIAIKMDDGTTKIWDVALAKEIHHIAKEKPCRVESNRLVFRKGDAEVIAEFENDRGKVFFDTEKEAVDLNPQNTIARQSLEGGSIRLCRTLGLSGFNKRILLAKGAVSLDQDFFDYCNMGTYTQFQASMMAQAFELGWHVEKDQAKAHYWTCQMLGQAHDFEGLVNLAKEGSGDAFKVLMEFARQKEEDDHKFPEAVNLVAQCFENGWSVERDLVQHLEWRFYCDHDFLSLESKAQQGSQDAFQVLLKLAQELKHNDIKYPQAAKILSACYLEGWGVGKDPQKHLEWLFRFNRDFESLRLSVQQGSMDAFHVLQTLAKETRHNELRYPEAAKIIARCFLEGWSVEKDLQRHLEWQFRYDHNYETLKQSAEQGSVDAFNVLLKLAQEARDDVFRRPEAMNIVVKCYEGGWGVNENKEMAHYWICQALGRSRDCEQLKSLAQEGSSDAFQVLLNLAQQVEDDETPKYLDAVYIVAKCYERGWGVEKNSELAHPFFEKHQKYQQADGSLDEDEDGQDGGYGYDENQQDYYDGGDDEEYGGDDDEGDDEEYGGDDDEGDDEGNGDDQEYGDDEGDGDDQEYGDDEGDGEGDE